MEIQGSIASDFGEYNCSVKNTHGSASLMILLKHLLNLVVEEETGLILCELCFAEKESQGYKNPGQFKMDLGGVETEGDISKQSRNFINLKKSIKKAF